MSENENQRIIDNKYIIKKRIAQGAFGKVYLVKKIGDDKHEYAAKVLISNDKVKEECFRNEIEIYKKLKEKINNDKYIPIFYDSGEGFITKGKKPLHEKKRLYFVLNYFKNGNLDKYIIPANYHFSERHAKFIFKKILKGIEFCHNANICHLDIKLKNILLDLNYNPIIADFGFANYIKDNKGKIIEYNDCKGTPEYICPEMYIEKKFYYGDKADIFSLGVVLFLLVTGKYGFNKAIQKNGLYQFIANKNYGIYWSNVGIDLNLKEDFKKLYVKMVGYNGETRPTIEKIFDDDWFKEIADLQEDADEYKNLENEISKEFSEIKEKNNLNEELSNNIEEGDNSSNRNIPEKYTTYFGSKLEPKNIINKQLNVDNYIKITGYLKPVEFMNILLTKIEDKWGTKDCHKEPSSKYLRCDISFDKDIYDENDKEILKESQCVFSIKLYKDENGNYYLGFIKKEGEYEDYYEYFNEIKNIIKKLIN